MNVREEKKELFQIKCSATGKQMEKWKKVLLENQGKIDAERHIESNLIQFKENNISYWLGST